MPEGTARNRPGRVLPVLRLIAGGAARVAVFYIAGGFAHSLYRDPGFFVHLFFWGLFCLITSIVVANNIVNLSNGPRLAR